MDKPTRSGAPPPLRLRFDAFELDEANARLTREGQALPVPPKAFAVLCTLAREPGRLVTKHALLDAVWGHQHVSESVLKTLISELRSVLADDARRPRFIETASRRGYRFIATSRPATAAEAQASAIPSGTPRTSAAPALIGRGAALERLGAAWADALAGHRRIVWITGEAGIGKTTLIENFRAGLGAAVVAQGQCVGEFGSGEPYLPVLEALGAMCRTDPSLVALMRRVAPTWLAQLPWLSTDAEREALQRTLVGASQDRMLREFGELLDRYTEQRPLLLITEDLHWGDHATIRLIDHIARRRSLARLMWLASFRIAEVVVEDHPLKALRHELRLHRLCEEIMLEPFSELELGQYLTARLPNAAFPESVVRALHSRTDGLPLFVVNVLDDADLGQALESSEAGAEELAARWKVPESLAGIIEGQIARLSPEHRLVLEAASVCGVEFRLSTIATLIDREAEAVRACCDDLVRGQHWLGAPGVEHLPDGSLDARYGFRHALYQHVVYQGIGALARAQLHRKVAHQMEARVGVVVTPAELASHYERGADPATAVRHYAAAAAGALRQLAPSETLHLSRHALALLARCPEGTSRDQLELALLRPRAIALQQLTGAAAPETAATYERILALADLLPEKTAHGLELGLGWVYFVRGEYDKAHALGTRIDTDALAAGDGARHVAACNLLGATVLYQGELASSKQWFEEGLRTCGELAQRFEQSPLIVDLETVMRARFSHALSHLGLAGQAMREVEASLARSASLGQPVSRGVALLFGALLYLRLERPEQTLGLADALIKLAADHALIELQGPALCLRGCAVARCGEPDAGLALIEQGAEHYIGRGNLGSGSPALLGFAAEALAIAGRWSAAQTQLDRALAISAHTGERVFVPDLLLLSARVALGRGERELAQGLAQAALREAGRQQAAWLELAARVELCELGAPAAEDLQALRDAIERLPEVRDTPLASRARGLARTFDEPSAR